MKPYVALTLLLTGCAAWGVAPADEWPIPVWHTATPESQGMDSAQLQKARDYALRGGGSGMIVRHGFAVYSWGSLTTLYPMRSTTKSFGATALGLALKDGHVTLSGKAQSYFAGIGVPPDSNVATGWLGDITILQLATHTAGFDKPGGEYPLIFKPGTEWGYSDGGADWLADVLTTRYGKDLFAVMKARVFTNLGVLSPADLTWRRNEYRSDTLNGIKRREFGSGIDANVNAMARLGLLYLRNGIWNDTRILSSSFVTQVHTVPASLAGLPITNPNHYPHATSHYGLLWWNNADGRMAGVPKDAYWTWGQGDSLIIVIPSLDIVVARAGLTIRATPPTDPAVLEPFVGPIVAATQYVAPTQSASVSAPSVVSAGSDRTLVLPQNTIALSGAIKGGRSGGAPTVQWKDAGGGGAIIHSPADPNSLVTFPSAGTYVLELSANDDEQHARDTVAITVADPATPATKMTAVTTLTTKLGGTGVRSAKATWLGFSPAVAGNDAIATLRVPIAQVNAPGRIEVHRVLGTWDARSLGKSGPPPIDTKAVASFNIEADDAGLTLETDVSDAVSTWTAEDAARGFVLIGISGDVAVASDPAGAAPEIRLDR